MPRYIVRVDVTYSALVEAESEDDAISQAPSLPQSMGEWDQSTPGDYEAEEE